MKLRSNWNNPFWFKKNLMHKVVLPILFARNDGDYILEQKWDNLIILDACRYDVFKELYAEAGLKGRLESRTSRGTETKSFLSENFGDVEKIRDLVYVTANPLVTKLFNDKFFKIIPVWKDSWSAENQTVLPEQMYEHALEAMRQYQDKRLIIHFLQPHRPFIGYARRNWWKTKVPNYRFLALWGTMAEDGKSLLFSVSMEAMMRLYKRNLRLVLPYVRRLLDALPGVTVVTADHGEAFGESIHPLFPISVYGHPGHTRIRALTKVPWLVVESQKKKVVSAGVEEVQTEFLAKEDEDLINKRLSALGYS